MIFIVDFARLIFWSMLEQRHNKNIQSKLISILKMLLVKKRGNYKVRIIFD